MAGPNVFADEWERDVSHGPFGIRGSRVGAAAGAERLGASVYELAPGKRNLPYHAHFGIEELLIVLSGSPTLRSPAGERQLVPGEVVAFAAGRDGAHQLINDGDSAVRYLMLSTTAPADLVEYPDSHKIAAMGGGFRAPGAVSYMLSTAEQLGYFDGEAEEEATR
ncbi:MAG TPA: cupin domain-containing protein [Solirubrobacteraceae bacterium]|nr:cupin domain-containing protein [Solirubrobacteraceae bacterium]